MDPFKVGDVRDLFASDLERLLTLSYEGLRRLVRQTRPIRREVEDLIRHAHTLKGLVSTVHGWGLACWGADLEKLYELAIREGVQRPEESRRIFEFVLNHIEDWRVLNNLTLKESMQDAWECYLRLRVSLDKSWGQHLTPLAEHENARRASAQQLGTRGVFRNEVKDAKPIQTERSPIPRVSPKPVIDEAVVSPPQHNPTGSTTSPRNSRLPALSPPPLLSRPDKSVLTVSLPPLPPKAKHQLPLQFQNPLPSLIPPTIRIRTASRPINQRISSPGTSDAIGQTLKGSPASSDTSLMPFFIRDANQQLNSVDEALLSWNASHPNEEAFGAVQRALHTLKAAAQTTGLGDLAETLHAIESRISRGSSDPSTSVLFTQDIPRVVAALRLYLTALESNPQSRWGENAPKSSSSPQGQDALSPSLDAASGEFEAVPNRVDALLQSLLGIQKSYCDRTKAFADNLQEIYSAKKKIARTSSTTTPPFKLDAGTESSVSAESVQKSLKSITQDFHQLNEAFAKGLDTLLLESTRWRQLSQTFQGSRLSTGRVSMETLQTRLTRVFEDALRIERKEAQLKFEGAELILDQSLVQRLFSPFMHLLRNAVAHGIELPEARSRSGKPRSGLVTLKVATHRERVVLTLSDDGAGIDHEQVRQRAIERGWISELTENLTKEQVFEFIFKPGFSTAPLITSVSGRGIGLDVVRKEIESLKGTVHFDSVVGQGTTWIISLPPSVTS